MKDGHFFVRLESLRGIAALTVAAMHSMSLFSPLEISDAGSIALRHLLNGQGAVNLFFVLSGFVLGASISRGLAANASLGFFLIARLFRIYPAVIVTVLIYAAIFKTFGPSPGLWNGDVTLASVVANATLFDTSLNGAMWSLQVEVLAIPFVLAIGLAESKVGPIAPAIAASIFVALIFTKAWAVGNVSLAPLFGFALGMCARHWSRPVARLNPLALAAIFAVAFTCFEITRALLPASTAGYRWITIVECVCSAFFVAIAAFSSNRWFTFLEGPIPRFYGRISYSFYLVHPMALVILAAFVPASSVTAFPQALLMIALVLLITTAIAWPCWRFVEQPAIALGKQVRHASRQAATG